MQKLAHKKTASKPKENDLLLVRLHDVCLAKLRIEHQASGDHILTP